MAEEKQRELRVVMFPWLAYGHMAPFLELAKSLSTHGLHIFFVSTPLNIQRLKPQMSDAKGHVELVELAMPTVEGLPAGVESTADVSKQAKGGALMPLLFQAVDLMEKPFEELLRQMSADLVIHDCTWVPRVAAKLAIRNVFFLVLGAASFSFSEGQQFSVPENPTAEDLAGSPAGFPSQAIRRRLFETRRVLGIYSKPPGGQSLAEKVSVGVRESWAVACNTCVEVEGPYLDYLQALLKRPVHPVGFLMPKLPPPPTDGVCLHWLDRQPAASVVLSAFGSEYALAAGDVAAMALGLQESGAAFIWVLPAANTLPEGLKDQIGEKGLIVTKWAPQLHILNHPSTGAFLTHCGWSSTAEALRFGVPIIALPMQFEQGLNARLVQELKVGVEVVRNEHDGSFTKEDISKAIKYVMVEGGEEIKSSVKKISNMLTSNDSQLSARNIRNFVSALRTPNE